MEEALQQSEETLCRQASELQARNEELDAFAQTVAHDLKNPVGLVIGFAEEHELGLSSVERIVEKLGGQAGVESEGVPGQGNLFSLLCLAPAIISDWTSRKINFVHHCAPPEL